MTNERETKRIDQVEPGDVLADFDDGIVGDVFLTVRLAEPIAEEPGRFHLVFAGGSYSSVRGTTEVWIATEAEIEEHEARMRDAEKRARMRVGLMKLIEALDAGLPLPAHFEIQGICMDSPADVRAAAALLGVEATDSDNGHRQTSTDVKMALAGDRDGDVRLRLWHLSRPAPDREDPTISRDAETLIRADGAVES